MSIRIDNHVPGMIELAGKCVDTFGKDKTKQVNYTFNQQGFRGPEFDFQPSYAFFGCSLVFGIGVHQQNTFAYRFLNSQNYGLAGNYTDKDTAIIMEKFLNSAWYNSQVKIAVVWKYNEKDVVDNFYNQIKTQPILHFFCKTPPKEKNCYAMPADLDLDISNTHPGPRTHEHLWKILTSLFRL